MSVTVKCAECGNHLSVHDENICSWGEHRVVVSPCRRCIDHEKDKAAIAAREKRVVRLAHPCDREYVDGVSRAYRAEAGIPSGSGATRKEEE